MAQLPIPTALTRNEEIRRLRALPPDERPSLAQLAEVHKISRERIRQIEYGSRRPKSSGRRVYGDVELVKEGQGRYEAIIKPDGMAKRVGLVLGGNRRWTLERPDRPAVHADSLAKLADRIAQDSLQ